MTRRIIRALGLSASAGPARPSWRPADEQLARDVLARLEHHARTFPAPTELDGPVTRRAALDLTRLAR